MDCLHTHRLMRAQIKSLMANFLSLLFLLPLLTSCTPMAQMQRICVDCTPLSLNTALSPIYGWARSPVELHNSNVNARRPLHIYIENDGAAYLSPNQIAANPSLRANLLVLRLMQLDTQLSLYLTRPCYGLAVNAMPATCDARYWTRARYSQEVVNALSHAIDQAKQKLQQSSAPVVLIGHSGGGSLAMLIAQSRKDVKTVVTLAGNLDTDTWVKLHGYGPLDQSLNPFAQALLGSDVQRWHFAGANDRNIPPSLINASCEKDPQAQCIIVPGVNHTEGWLEHWPALLARISASPAL